MFEERRRLPRVRSYVPVRIHTPHVSHAIETLTKDIGLGGLRCVSQTLCPVATELTVQLTLAPGSEQIALRARAAWFRAIPESEQFDLGIEFIDVSPETKRRLSVFVENFSKRTSPSQA